MNKKVYYLSPQVESKQEFVCWGFAKNDMTEETLSMIKPLILEGLAEVGDIENKWVRERSFSVLFGTNPDEFWVALPRQLSIKVMTILNEKFQELLPGVRCVITSYKNTSNPDCHFYPVISYDRGFVYDAEKIGAAVMETCFPNVVNS